MPFFRVELERHVSRVVELRQTTTVVVKAPGKAAAMDAVLNIAGDENQLCHYMDEWNDDNGSRQASNDEQVRRPSITAASPAAQILAWPNTLYAMPEPEVPDAE